MLYVAAHAQNFLAHMHHFMGHCDKSGWQRVVTGWAYANDVAGAVPVIICLIFIRG